MLNQKPSQQSIDVVNLEEEEKMKVPSPTSSHLFIAQAEKH